MYRECNKCVYHTSGSCSQWECKGATTIKDIRVNTINRILNNVALPESARYCIEQMKGGAE